MHLNLNQQGNCTIGINKNTITIDCHDKEAQHYFCIEGITLKNAETMSQQLIEAIKEIKKGT